jgi:hypothetical protein
LENLRPSAIRLFLTALADGCIRHRSLTKR